MELEPARPLAAQRPRRLRLDELLRELGAHDGEHAAATDVAAEAASDVEAATDATTARRSGVTVGELVDTAGAATFGFSIGVLALIAIPFFGLSTPFGLAIALIGAQLAVGRPRPWLPARLRRRQLSMTMLDRVLRLLGRRMRWLAASTRRRWDSLVTPRLIGVAITFLGLGLALPLPIPGSNMIFIVPILIYAIALLEGDGMWSALGHLCTLVDLALLVAFGATVVAVLERVWQWLT